MYVRICEVKNITILMAQERKGKKKKTHQLCEVKDFRRTSSLQSCGGDTADTSIARTVYELEYLVWVLSALFKDVPSFY